MLERVREQPIVVLPKVVFVFGTPKIGNLGPAWAL